jgi:hypothetical protein
MATYGIPGTPTYSVTFNSLDDIAKKVKRLTYDLETVRRLVENTTDIDRVRDDLDATIHKVRQLELAYQN